MNRPLHESLPFWAISVLSNKNCSRCSKAIDRKSISGVGIRQEDNSFTFTVEHGCNCGYREIICFPQDSMSNLEDLCHVILEGLIDKERISKSFNIRTKPNDESAMTDEEVNNFLEFMNKANDYDDVLKHIGHRDRQIQSSEEDKEPEKKKNKKPKNSDQKKGEG